MVSIIKVTPLYILLSGRKKRYHPIPFWSLESIIEITLCILFCRGDSVFLISINHLWWKWVTFFHARNCYELPSSWSGVTSFPVKTLNCHISRTRHPRIPVFALNWDLFTSILYTKNRAISPTWTLRIWSLFVPFEPAAATRGRR